MEQRLGEPMIPHKYGKQLPALIFLSAILFLFQNCQPNNDNVVGDSSSTAGNPSPTPSPGAGPGPAPGPFPNPGPPPAPGPTPSPGPGGIPLPRPLPAPNAVGNFTIGGAAPIERARHTAVWTGSRMLVFGGEKNTSPNTLATMQYYADGSSFDPASNTWTAISATNAPSARSRHSAIWTGTRMIIWGGSARAGGALNAKNDGAIYDPATNTWTPMSSQGAPSAREDHTAVWTGSRMIVFGGSIANIGNCVGLGSCFTGDGASFDPNTNTWTPISTTNAPLARGMHSAVWTGSRMVVWGGGGLHPSFGLSSLNSGGIYDPATDTWNATATAGAPAGRVGHASVWTGTRLIIFSGQDFYVGTYFADTFAFDPVTNIWTTLSSAGAPAARVFSAAVWTGSQMLVHGGMGLAIQNALLLPYYYFDGGVYTPASNSWLPMRVSNLPARNHSAVWDGSKMIIHGGYFYFNLNGIFPFSNSVEYFQ